MIHFIVSVLDRTASLLACLASLRAQTCRGAITVCDNGGLDGNYQASKEYGAHYINTKVRGAVGPYESAEMIAFDDKHPWRTAEWLCFPSDDSLYVSGFSEIMLREAELNKTAGLIHCSCIYRQDPITGAWPAYTVLESEPRMGRIDKTNFIIRRDVFKGFPPHPRDWRDGALIEQLKAQGVPMFKAPGCLVVHQ